MRIFASYVRPGEAGQFPALPGPDNTVFTDKTLTIVRHVLERGRPLGSIYMRVTHNDTETIVQNIGIGSVASMAALIVAFLLITRLEKIVTAPISAIATAAREVVLQRDYSRRVRKQSNDECGMMVESFNDMLAEMLAAAGYSTMIAHSGADVFSVLRHQRPDLIVMDVQMPGMNGIDIARRLKASPALAAIPLIIVTGNSEGATVKDSVQAGAVDFVVKPVEREIFLRKVAHALAPGTPAR